MNGAYPAMIKKYMPQAEIVYDRFHIVKNYREKVLIPAKNRVFTELSKGMKSDEKEKLRRQIKLMDWVLVMDEKSEKLKKPRERIEKFVKDNELLLELAPMMTKLREVWETWVCEDAAEKLHKVITEFEAIGRKHKFNPTKNFAGMLRRRSEGIITWGKHKISTGKLEGANNRIKTLKKITYGVEFEYFALKVKSMFPGKENVLKQIGRHSLLWQNQAIHTAPGKFVKNRITPRQVDVEALKRAKEAEALPPPALAVPEEAAPAVATP